MALGWGPPGPAAGHREALDLAEKDFEPIKHEIQKELDKLQNRAHREAKKLLSESSSSFIKLL